ncbi:hypothetical protein BDP27DRAFT_1267003 [Rhodocollybia butyracea]|uniref:Uncharacterized protein n=1 Tax=Rhodocollybia butyracea TaxID=206335 RepID=A0A9P5PRQ0_9AGAR|nr:hypothetical protein BDP27DRAFT_1267003 [Rhodocollybia butyracea]
MFSRFPTVSRIVLFHLVAFTFAYKQPFEYLVAIERFATAFNNPSSVVAGTLPAPLAKDVVGRVDITTTFVGQELNVEYLFGLFAESSLQNTTQLIGSPSSYTVQSLVVEPPVVAVSIINNLNYPTVNLSVPLQFDLFIAFDNDMNIISYDAIARRWGEFMDYVTPLLVPKIAEELNSTITNVTELITLKAAVDVCAMSTQYCTGTNQQYASNDACMSFMTQLPFGQSWAGGLDTGFCRYIHKNMVKFRPEVHCPHIGPTGGDMCIPRDYVQITENMPFNNTLLAYNSSYNRLDMENLPPANQLELVKVQTNIVYMTTVAFFSVSCVCYMLILYIIAKTIEMFLCRFSVCYRELSFANQRNTTTYVLDILITTAGLVLQLISSPVLVSRYTFNNFGMLKVTALLISGLYIFELTYRSSMRWPLMIHHFSTIFSIVLLLSVASYTSHPALMGAGEIWLFQATTEQSVFIGLLMYRLGSSPKLTYNVLYFASIQSFIFKLAFATYLIVFWAQKLVRFHSSPDDLAFSVFLVVLVVLLVFTQIYGAWAVWSLATRVNRSIHTLSESMMEAGSRSDSTVDVSEPKSTTNKELPLVCIVSDDFTEETSLYHNVG